MKTINNLPHDRAAWMKPEVKRIEAGSAENGPRAATPDADAQNGGGTS